MKRRGTPQAGARGHARRLRVPTVALLTLLVLAVPVAAHADLESAEPPPNSRVDTAPAVLSLSFSERLSDQYTRVVVLDGDGRDHANETRIDPDNRRRVTVPLEPLPDGVYTIQWRTLSSEDGHTRSGVYFLAVNASVSDAGPGGDGSGGFDSVTEDPVLAQTALRAVAFAGASLAAGLPLFHILTQRIDVPGRVRGTLRWFTVAGALAAAAGAAGLLMELASRIETSFMVAAETEPGRLLTIRTAVFLAAFLVCLIHSPTANGARNRPALLIGLAFALAGLAATSLGGHAAADTEARVWAVPNDWVHIVAVAFWVSGVVALVAASLDRTTTEPTGAALIRRFSPWAVAAVVLIVATGTIAAMDRLVTPSELWETDYGRALLAKILLTIPLIALGAYHRYRLLPALDEPGKRQHDFSRLKVSAGVEVAVMTMVLVAAGLLTSLSPPSAPVTGGGQAEARPFYEFDESGLNVRIFIIPTPVTVDFQEIYANATFEDGSKPERDQHEAFLFLHPPSGQGGEATPREAHFFANKTFHWSGALFTEPGNWTAELVIQGGQGDDFVYVQHEFPVAVRQA